MRKDHNSENRAMLVNRLNQLKNNHDELKPLFLKSLPVKEIESLSLALKTISVTGLKAVELLTENGKPEDEWKVEALKKIKAASAPVAEMDIMITGDIKDLVEAVK